MCPKRFSSLWYVRRKPCTYIAPTLTLSPNGPKRDSTWPTHLGVPSGASKTISEHMVRLVQTTQLSCVKISTMSKWTQASLHLSLVTWSTIECVQNDFWAYSTFCANRAPILHPYCTDTNTVSKRIEMRFHMTHSPRSSIWYVQDDFRAYGTFGINRAPILCQD
jgi:hypothetical protein